MHAQRDPFLKHLHAQVGLVNDGMKRTGYQLGLFYQSKKQVMGCLFYRNNDQGFAAFQNKKLNYISYIQNASLVYGYLLYKHPHFNVLPMAGISAGQGRWRNNRVDTTRTSGSILSWTNYTYHYDNFQYLGVILDLRCIYIPKENFGIMLEVFGNFHRHPDQGLTLSLVFGNLSK